MRVFYIPYMHVYIEREMKGKSQFFCFLFDTLDLFLFICVIFNATLPLC